MGIEPTNLLLAKQVLSRLATSPNWWRVTESNRREKAYETFRETSILPAKMVWGDGFEPLGLRPSAFGHSANPTRILREWWLTATWSQQVQQVPFLRTLHKLFNFWYARKDLNLRTSCVSDRRSDRAELQAYWRRHLESNQD